MKKGTILSLFALLISIVGLLIALIAYFKRRNCVLCDDLEDDLVEFYDEDEEEAHHEPKEDKAPVEDCKESCCAEKAETPVAEPKTEA